MKHELELLEGQSVTIDGVKVRCDRALQCKQGAETIGGVRLTIESQAEPQVDCAGRGAMPCRCLDSQPNAPKSPANPAPKANAKAAAEPAADDSLLADVPTL